MNCLNCNDTGELTVIYNGQVKKVMCDYCIPNNIKDSDIDEELRRFQK